MVTNKASIGGHVTLGLLMGTLGSLGDPKGLLLGLQGGPQGAHQGPCWEVLLRADYTVFVCLGGVPTVPGRPRLHNGGVSAPNGAMWTHVANFVFLFNAFRGPTAHREGGRAVGPKWLTRAVGGPRQ